MYNEKRIRSSELLRLILLDSLYAQSGSEHMIFQGGTALRWVYGGMRFSEDLDFVTNLPTARIILSLPLILLPDLPSKMERREEPEMQAVRNQIGKMLIEKSSPPRKDFSQSALLSYQGLLEVLSQKF